MSRRLFQVVAGIVLVLAALTPLTECFDSWERTPFPARDTEMYLTAVFVGVGLVLTLAKLLKYVPDSGSSRLGGITVGKRRPSRTNGKPAGYPSPYLIPHCELTLNATAPVRTLAPAVLNHFSLHRRGVLCFEVEASSR